MFTSFVFLFADSLRSGGIVADAVFVSALLLRLPLVTEQ